MSWHACAHTCACIPPNTVKKFKPSGTMMSEEADQLCKKQTIELLLTSVLLDSITTFAFHSLGSTVHSAHCGGLWWDAPNYCRGSKHLSSVSDQGLSLLCQAQIITEQESSLRVSRASLDLLHTHSLSFHFSNRTSSFQHSPLSLIN